MALTNLFKKTQSMKASNPPALAMTATDQTVIFTTKVDPNGLYNVTTGVYTVDKSGTHIVTSPVFSNFAGAVYDLYVSVFVNGSAVSVQLKTVSAGSANQVTFHDELEFQQGDLVTIRTRQSSAGGTLIAGTTSSLTITRIPDGT